MVEPFLDVLREYQSFMPMCAVRGGCAHLVPDQRQLAGQRPWCSCRHVARADVLNAQTC